MLSHKPIASFVLMTHVSVLDASLDASNFFMPVCHMVSVTQFNSDVIFCVLLIFANSLCFYICTLCGQIFFACRAACVLFRDLHTHAKHYAFHIILS